MGSYSSSMEVMYKEQRLAKKKKLSVVNPALFLLAILVTFIPGEVKYYAWGVLLLVYVARKAFPVL